MNIKNNNKNIKSNQCIILEMIYVWKLYEFSCENNRVEDGFWNEKSSSVPVFCRAFRIWKIYFSKLKLS